MAGVAAEQFGLSVRKFPAGNYMIYYRTGRSRSIQILHVFHGARQQGKAWGDESVD
jgi:plasmid stabilization system protein ParE